MIFFAHAMMLTPPNLKKIAMDALITSPYVTELSSVTEALSLHIKKSA